MWPCLAARPHETVAESEGTRIGSSARMKANALAHVTCGNGVSAHVKANSLPHVGRHNAVLAPLKAEGLTYVSPGQRPGNAAIDIPRAL